MYGKDGDDPPPLVAACGVSIHASGVYSAQQITVEKNSASVERVVRWAWGQGFEREQAQLRYCEKGRWQSCCSVCGCETNSMGELCEGGS